MIKAFHLFDFMTVYESVRAQVEGRECVKGSVQKKTNTQNDQMSINQSTSEFRRSYAVCNYVLPIKLAFIFLVEAKEKSVKGQSSDPPPCFDGAILWVLGQFQDLQPGVCVI